MRIIVLFFLFFAIYLNAQSGLPSNFNWKASSFTVYWQKYNNTPTSVTSPFYSNIIGDVAYTKDYEDIDGWVFVWGDFGSNIGYIKCPYFILYNKYQGLLRIFILVSSTEEYTQGSMLISFMNNTPKTALLTHATNRAWATDRYLPDNKMLGISDMINYQWYYLDYAMAYDPNTYNSTDSKLEIKLVGVTTTNLTINGTLNLTQELPKSTTNSDGLNPLSQLYMTGKSIAGYYGTFANYKEELNKSKEKETNSKLKTALTLLSNNWITKNLPFIGAGIGLIDFFVGGGRTAKKESPVPMVFNGEMKLSGTLTTNDNVFNFSIPTPGARHTSLSFVPHYDKPLGIFNLTQTPVLLSRQYWEPINSNQSMQYSSYQVKNDLSYAINPNSTLSLINLDVAVVFRFNANYPFPYTNIPGITNWLNSGIYEIETSKDSQYPVLRSKYIPYAQFKNTVINVPPGTDVTIKVKATLRPAGATSETQDVLYIADYEPIFESSTGAKYSWNPAQLVPYKPKNVVHSFNSSNHNFLELNWDLATGIEKYEIWKKTNTTWEKLAEVGPSVSSYTDITEIKSNPAYGPGVHRYYKIRSVDYGNNFSVYSDEVDAIVNPINPWKNKNEEEDVQGIKEFALNNNYPNPFNPTTHFSYQIPHSEFVTLKIFNPLGQEVKTLVNEYQNQGYYEVAFDGSDLSSGIYFYRMQAGEFVSTRKMILAK